MGITASHFTPRTRFTTHVETEIYPKRGTLTVNLSTCLPKEPTQPTMQETPVVSISAPQTWGAEMVSFPMEEEFLLSLLKDQDTQRSISTHLYTGCGELSEHRKASLQGL